MAVGKNKKFGSCFFAKVLRGFLEEMEEEKKKHRNKRRKHRGNCFRDMNDFYSGFGKRHNDDDDDDDDDDDLDDEENEDEEEDDDDEEDEDEDKEDYDDDEDEDEADDQGRGCGIAGEKAKGRRDPMELMSGLGRYFNASDYDEDYEE